MRPGHIRHRQKLLAGLGCRGAGRRVLGLLRYGVALLALAQLLGLTHAAADLFELTSAAQHCGDRCGDEDGRGDVECPPFCPTCVCSHAAQPLITTPFRSVGLARLEPPQLLDLPRSIWLYDNPPVTSIFRPPRR